MTESEILRSLHIRMADNESRREEMGTGFPDETDMAFAQMVLAWVVIEERAGVDYGRRADDD